MTGASRRYESKGTAVDFFFEHTDQRETSRGCFKPPSDGSARGSPLQLLGHTYFHRKIKCPKREREKITNKGDELFRTHIEKLNNADDFYWGLFAAEQSSHQLDSGLLTSSES